uniref:Heme O synthase n=1 Tax=Alexandrium monilatum TaxID=311494 RepID=A0A7S4QCW4_9DINO
MAVPAVATPAAAAPAVPCAAALPQVAEPEATSARGSRSLSLYWKLSKGKLTVWVSLSAIPGYLAALPGAVDPLALAALAGGTFLTSASAQTLNQLFEIERDAKMKRTAQRPLPSGQMTPAQAAWFASASGTLGLATLSLGTTPLAAAVAGATMATYAAVYTPMKVLSPYNTHVGAISGSLPTLLGFAAALGTDLVASPWALPAAWLFGMQTLWQMPHFYSLAWLYRSDYMRGGYKMFPLSDETGHLTAAMSKPYLATLCAMPWGLSAFGLASWMLPIGAAVPSWLWWRSLASFEQKPNAGTCKRFFLGSLSYLLSMLALFTAFVRAPTPAALPAEEGSSEQAPKTGDAPEFLEPAWRARMRAYFMDACPHETMRHVFFGAGRSGCPMHRE